MQVGSTNRYQFGETTRLTAGLGVMDAGIAATSLVHPDAHLDTMLDGAAIGLHVAGVAAGIQGMVGSRRDDGNAAEQFPYLGVAAGQALQTAGYVTSVAGHPLVGILANASGLMVTALAASRLDGIPA